MNIIELITKVGLDKVETQMLLEAVTNISSSRRGVSRVTFLTTHLSPRDFIVPGGEVGVILWIKREDLPAQMRAPAPAKQGEAT